MNSPVKMYLDVDGVINRLDSGGDRQQFIAGYSISWDQETIDRLSALPEHVEIVWLTTWREHTALLEEDMDFHRPARWLPWDGADGQGKLDALREDQEEDPTRVIWVDDYATLFYNPEIDPEDWIIVRPNSRRGLTPEHLDNIEYYVDS